MKLMEINEIMRFDWAKRSSLISGRKDSSWWSWKEIVSLLREFEFEEHCEPSRIWISIFPCCLHWDIRCLNLIKVSLAQTFNGSHQLVFLVFLHMYIPDWTYCTQFSGSCGATLSIRTSLFWTNLENWVSPKGWYKSYFKFVSKRKLHFQGREKLFCPS